MGLRLLKLSFISLGMSAGVFLALRLFLPLMFSCAMAVLFFILLLAMLLLVTSRKMSRVMKDSIIKCPRCGSEIEAAFINEKLAMSFKCPSCGKIISS
jgi:predicted RNA-binding Zn-ribbon protein involved in translation (DUF1610 family)